MKCTVLRRIPGADGATHMPGDIVDSSDWLHEERLINQRYLQPMRGRKAEPTAAEEAKKVTPVPVRSKSQRVGK
jgi:hypothetical protein